MNEFKELFNDGFRWLACDDDGELFAYKNLPYHSEGVWYAEGRIKSVDNIYTITPKEGLVGIERCMHENVYQTLLKENANKHDDHYKALEIEPWDIMKADFTKEELKGFFKGNILKYLLRNKEGVKDVDKLINYARELKQLLESEEK